MSLVASKIIHNIIGPNNATIVGVFFKMYSASYTKYKFLQLVFDNNSLEIKQSTFFTYNKDANNVYDCSPSITGNPKFEYCGPEAYYESPTF